MNYSKGTKQLNESDIGILVLALVLDESSFFSLLVGNLYSIHCHFIESLCISVWDLEFLL